MDMRIDKHLPRAVNAKNQSVRNAHKFLPKAKLRITVGKDPHIARCA